MNTERRDHGNDENFFIVISLVEVYGLTLYRRSFGKAVG